MCLDLPCELLHLPGYGIVPRFDAPTPSSGFLIAGVCGYMAGLIGASNSPISGVGILSVVLCASTLALAVP